MGKIASLKLKPGYRIGSYKIIKPLGRGWEGEVYQVEEVPTEAKRAMKILVHNTNSSIRNYIHTAWYFEQLSHTSSVAKYYHMGQWFLKDDEGLFFLIFEKLDGLILKEYIKKHSLNNISNEAISKALFLRIIDKVVRIHNEGYGVGDFSNGENIIIKETGADPVFCDLDPGTPDKPNAKFTNDFYELRLLLPLFLNKKNRYYKITFDTIKGFERLNNNSRISQKLYLEIKNIFGI